MDARPGGNAGRVALAPDNVAVRIPRGAVLLTASHYIPDAGVARPLIADGVADYQRTYDLQKEYFATLGSHPRGELLFGLAEGYSRLGDQDIGRRVLRRDRQDAAADRLRQARDRVEGIQIAPGRTDRLRGLPHKVG